MLVYIYIYVIKKEEKEKNFQIEIKMNSLLNSSRENILDDESFIRLSPVDNTQTTNKTRIKSAVSNRISSAVANTREASNKFKVANNGYHYPLTITREASIFDEFSGSINSTFIAENTIKTNLTEEHIIDSFTSNVNLKKQPLAPLKQLKSVNNNVDKVPAINTDILITPFIAISNEEKERLETLNKNAKIPPIKPIKEKNLFKINNDPPISPVPITPTPIIENIKSSSPLPSPLNKSPELVIN